MSNAEKPASPFTGMGYEGLTKREYFAGLAMQGWCAADRARVWSFSEMASLSVAQADALLAALEKGE
jgi:hypothetical protein